MIKENLSVTKDFWLEGFSLSLSPEFQLTVSEGATKQDVRKKSGNMTVNMTDNLTYPEFSFFIEPDKDLQVIYDVYLLYPTETIPEEDSIQIDRTEIGSDDTIAFYEGEQELNHCLLTIQVPSGNPTTDEIGITVNRVDKKQPNPTEEDVQNGSPTA